MLLFKKLLLSLLFSITTVLSVSKIDVHCDFAIFYLIKPWVLVVESLAEYVFVKNLLINIGAVFLIYAPLTLLLLIRVKNITKRHFKIATMITALSVLHLGFFMLLHGEYYWADSKKYIDSSMTDNNNFYKNPPMKTQLGFILHHQEFSYEQCKPFLVKIPTKSLDFSQFTTI